MPAPRRSTTQQRSRPRPEGEAVEAVKDEPTPVVEPVAEPTPDVVPSADVADTPPTDVVVSDAVPVPAESVEQPRDDAPNDVPVDTRSAQEIVEQDKLTIEQIVDRHARIGHDRFVVAGVLAMHDDETFTLDEAKAIVDKAVETPIGGDGFDDDADDQTEEV